MVDSKVGQKGGEARAASLTDERKKEIAQRAALARWGGAQATHSGILKIGEEELPCYVLESGERVLSTRGIMKSLGRTWRGRKYAGTQLPVFLEAGNLNAFIPKNLGPVLEPIFFRTDQGVKAEGFRAEILPVVCETYLAARAAGQLTEPQQRIAQACEVLVRALSRVGVIALVDEATGFQRDRAKDALAKILEEFIAKELRPWVPTFPDAFYEHLFRLRGLQFPRDSVKRPMYFGHLTNNIIYDRLAPHVRSTLHEVTPRSPSGRLKHHLHRRLTDDIGHPKLRDHLTSVVTIMRLSNDYDDFMGKLDQIHPRFGDNYALPLDVKSDPDTGL